MNGFTYENQGAETLLVYHLGADEHLDHFAKGMLQSNDMAGILRPSFIQRDLDQYLKFPVTSKIPLKDFLQNEMERETVLKLCLTIVSAVGELEEYMLSRDKVLLDPDYIFVDITKKEASLLYLPVDEFEQVITVEEFLLYFISHMRFKIDKDVSYVAKLIHFLNQTKAWEFQELERYIKKLLEEKNGADTSEPERQRSNRPIAGLGDDRRVIETVPASNQSMLSSDRVLPPEPQNYVGGNSALQENVGNIKLAMAPQDNVMPAEPEEEGKKKKGWFGKREKKEKEPKKAKGGISLPGMEVPGMAVPGMSVPGKQQPEVVLNVNEEGQYLQEQAAPEEKKKGLFHFGKKKKEEKAQEISPFENGSMAIPGAGAMAIPGAGAMAVPEAGSMAVPGAGAGSIPGSAGGRMVFPQTSPMQSSASMAGNVALYSQVQQEAAASSYSQSGVAPGYQQEREGATVYMGRGSSDDDNKTVIMGGGKEYGSTVILGGGSSQMTGQVHRVVRLTRRRTGQSMMINKEIFHIGREASFVDFYIGDNQAIGAIHADIFADDGQYFVSDRNSVNHTYLNGTMVAAGQPQLLKSGDVISLADEDFDFIIS